MKREPGENDSDNSETDDSSEGTQTTDSGWADGLNGGGISDDDCPTTNDPD